jgi:UDP-3-O-[3-hydroxymyristoyl] glucosamine N-acyltransferase
VGVASSSSMAAPVTVGELYAAVCATLPSTATATLLSGADTAIDNIAPLEQAGAASIAFVSNVKYQSQIDTTQAACLIVAPALSARAVAKGACIEASDPYLFFALLTQWWRARQRGGQPVGVHPSAVVDASARIDASATIGPLAVVGAHAVIGPGARIDAHACIEPRAHIGAQTHIRAHVVVGFDCVIGQRCIVHAGVVIGADGFGFAQHNGEWIKIEQLGAVRIGDDVEIGANTCIDRGALGDTVIGNGVKLDNLIQIGHNVHIGEHTAMAGCAGVAGSAHIGAHCTVGGGAIVLGHLQLADRVHISAATVVMRSISQPGVYTGVFPIDDNSAWEKNAVTLKQLHRLRDRLKSLEKAAAR